MGFLILLPPGTSEPAAASEKFDSGQIEDGNADSLSGLQHALVVRSKLDVLILPHQEIE